MPHLSAAQTDTDSINRYYAECEASGEPYVLCLFRRTQADVRFDYISLGVEQIKALDEHAEEIRGAVDEIYNKYPHKWAVPAKGPKLIEMRDLAREDAEAADAELHACLSRIVRP